MDKELAELVTIIRRAKYPYLDNNNLSDQESENEAQAIIDAGYTLQPEPSEKSVEAVAQFLCLLDGLEWSWLKEQQRYLGQKDCEYYIRVAREICKLQPELTLIGEEEKMACSAISKYPFTEIMDVIDEACQHQLAHDQEIIKEG